MDNNVVVSVKGVSKKFCKRLRRSMAYGIVDLGKNLIGVKPDLSKLRRDEFWALEDVSFELKKGETLGLIGPNGSGKTTLLRLLAGIFPPDKGEISVKGRVGALIAVGAGFHPHMTGRENIYLNGSILGMNRKEIDAKFQDIVNFAEIDDFLDAPVSTYSSGMRVRLGFSIAVHLEPDILIVDEVIAVGDIRFKRKCFKRIKELSSSGTSIIFVSHQLYILGGLCDRTILLEKGRLQNIGRTKEIIELYELREKGKVINDEVSQHENEQRYDEFRPIEVVNCKLMDVNGIQRNNFNFDERIKFCVNLIAHKRIEKPLFMFGFRRSDGVIITHYNSRFDNFDVHYLERQVYLEVELDLSDIRLTTDYYSIYLHILEWDAPHFSHPNPENITHPLHGFVVGSIQVKHPFLKSFHGASERRAKKWIFKNGDRKYIHDDIPNDSIYKTFNHNFKN